MMGNVFAFGWEVSFMQWFQNALHPFFAAIVNNLSLFGEETLMIAILGFIYWSWNKKKGKFIGLSVMLACVWNPLIKNIFLRRRPYMDNEGIEIKRLVEADADPMDVSAQGFSFPSGHSMTAVAAYGSIWMKLKRNLFKVLAFVLPLAVGVSRVFVGAHYPTDVLVGWAMGILILFVVKMCYKRIKNEAVLYAIFLITALPGFFYCTSTDYFTCYGMLFGACMGFLYEKKYVKFKKTRVPLSMALRPIGGFVIYLILNTLLKLPFPKEFLETPCTAAFLVRAARYAIILFMMIGVYPHLFKLKWLK